MKKPIVGVVVSGTGQASAHVIPGLNYFPGSLNVFVGRSERNKLLHSAMMRYSSTRSVNAYRTARLFEEPVLMGFSRDKTTIELFSEKNLRATLGLKDGDRVKVYL